jgi:hypothetical protein
MKATNANSEAANIRSHGTDHRPKRLPNRTPINFARELRALGQALEKFSFSVFDIEIENGIYFVVDKSNATEQRRGLSLLRAIRGFFMSRYRSQTRPARQVDLRFTPGEIENFDLHGKSRRQDAGKTPDPYSISQLLRGAGCYLDNRDVAERVTISLAGRWITIRYETPDKQAANARHDLEYFYDCWVQMYLRRSNRAKLPQASEPTVRMRWQTLGDS